MHEGEEDGGESFPPLSAGFTYGRDQSEAVFDQLRGLELVVNHICFPSALSSIACLFGMHESSSLQYEKRWFCMYKNPSKVWI